MKGWSAGVVQVVGLVLVPGLQWSKSGRSSAVRRRPARLWRRSPGEGPAPDGGTIRDTTRNHPLSSGMKNSAAARRCWWALARRLERKGFRCKGGAERDVSPGRTCLPTGCSHFDETCGAAQWRSGAWPDRAGRQSLTRASFSSGWSGAGARLDRGWSGRPEPHRTAGGTSIQFAESESG